jgi:hypothetical protein
MYSQFFLFGLDNPVKNFPSYFLENPIQRNLSERALFSCEEVVLSFFQMTIRQKVIADCQRCFSRSRLQTFVTD